MSQFNVQAAMISAGIGRSAIPPPICIYIFTKGILLMKKRLLFFLSALCLILNLNGCERATEPSAEKEISAVPAITHATKTPFSDQIQPDLFELPSGALTIWRKYAGNKPALLLFSAHPFLEPLPQEDLTERRKFIKNGSDIEIIRRGQLFVADPAFFPAQTVSAAIEADLFSELIVVLPLPGPLEEMSLNIIRGKMQSSGFLSEEESAALKFENGVVSGSLRGLPIRLVHPEALPQLTEPVLLHLDLSYFKGLYVNEIKTPLFDLLFKNATAIREKNYPALAVSLSYSNQEIGIPLSARFVMRSLADILRQPQQLSENQPDSWKILSHMLNLNAMYMEGSAREVILENAQKGQDDPAFLYALAVAYFQNRQPQEGFASLEQAVALDPGYGLEYLTLAEQGEKNGQQAKALELMRKAVAAFPADPFLRLQLAEMMIRQGLGTEAEPILAELSRLPWSARLYADMPEYLNTLTAKLK
jgi:hypothetical protein